MLSDTRVCIVTVLSFFKKKNCLLFDWSFLILVFLPSDTSVVHLHTCPPRHECIRTHAYTRPQRYAPGPNNKGGVEPSSVYAEARGFKLKQYYVILREILC